MVATIAKALPKLSIESNDDLIQITRKGLNVKFLSDIMIYTGMSNKELAAALPISERQLVRYAVGKLLKPEVTERLLRLVALYADGYDLFNEKEDFQKWMRAPNWSLGRQTPMSFLDTSFGLEEIKAIIGRIAWGVYS